MMAPYRKLVVTILIVICCSKVNANNDYAPLFVINKKKVAQQNEMLIHFFINFELTEKNYNLSTIVAYVPNLKKRKAKEVKYTSNLGGAHEELFFRYKQGKLVEIDYFIDRKDNEGVKRYRYFLEYENELLKRIKIRSKVKYTLAYNSKNKLASISFTRGNNSYSYNFEYSDHDTMAKLRLDVIKNGKVYIGHDSQKTAIHWNKKYQLTSYEIYRYTAHSIKYNQNDDISSFTYHSSRPKAKVSWSYSYDKNKNWITKTFEKTTIKRIITY